MRICHFFQSVRPEVGGPARGVLDLCAALAKRGHDVTLATCDLQGVPEAWRDGQPDLPRHVLLPKPAIAGAAFSPGQIRQARKLLRQADVLHVKGAWTYLNVQLARAATKQNVPYIVSICGMLDDWVMAKKTLKKRIYLSIFGKRWLQGAQAIHLTAQRELEESQKYFPGQRGVVIPNLLDLQLYAELPGPDLARSTFDDFEVDVPVVLSLSRIHPIKQLECLIRAASILKKQGVAFRVVLAGSGDERYIKSLRALAHELALTERDVQFVGQVAGDLKLSLYQAAELFALPSAHENFGFVLAEALACGTPVVTTPGVKICDEIASSGAGVIVPANPDSFAQAIRDTLAGGECAAMGARGRAWIFNWLDTDRLLERFEAMYQDQEDQQ